jgi:hypothetical protein
LIHIPNLCGGFIGGDISNYSGASNDCCHIAEKRLLLSLPAMSLANMMISNIEQTADQMRAFRQFIIARIDGNELQFSTSLALAVKQGTVLVNFLLLLSLLLLLLSL